MAMTDGDFLTLMTFYGLLVLHNYSCEALQASCVHMFVCMCKK